MNPVNPGQNVVSFTPSGRVRRYSYGSVATLFMGGAALVAGAFMVNPGVGLIALAYIGKELSASMHQAAQLHMQNEYSQFVVNAQANFKAQVEAEQGSRNPFAMVKGQGTMPGARVN